MNLDIISIPRAVVLVGWALGLLLGLTAGCTAGKVTRRKEFDRLRFVVEAARRYYHATECDGWPPKRDFYEAVGAFEREEERRTS